MVAWYYILLLSIEGILGYISDERSYRAAARFGGGVAALLIA
jgi:hypothetical protein